MKTEDYINNYIEKEKQIEPTPYLATRILARIESFDRKPVLLWQKLAIAASIVLVLMIGITIGNSYKMESDTYAGLNVNDSKIENFNIYNSESNE